VGCLLDSNALIQAFGSLAVFGVALIIFLETATIFGSFLPGDSLLFILGLTLATWLSEFPIWLAIPIVLIAAIAGAEVGYWFGKKLGPKLFKQRKTFFFNETTVVRTKQFFSHYGARSIVLSRFIPGLRALIPMFAAISDFDKTRFLKLNIIGGAIWVVGLTGAGYGLGQIDFVEKHIELFVIGFVVLSSLPLPIEILREKARQRKNLRRA
jgi:membrane-associated protein